MERRLPVLLAAFTVIASAWFLVEGQQYRIGTLASPGPGLYPFLVGVLLLVSTVGTVFEAAMGSHAVRAAAEWPDRAGWLRMGAVAAAALGYILLLPYSGDLIAGCLSMLLVIKAMGTRSWLWAVVVSIALTLIFHFLFDVALGVPLPQGSWFGS